MSIVSVGVDSHIISNPKSGLILDPPHINPVQLHTATVKLRCHNCSYIT